MDADLGDLEAQGEKLIDLILDHGTLSDVQLLVEDDAPLWYQNSEGLSALHAAACVENLEVTEYLIEKGSVWNAVDNLQNTAGDIALSLNNEGVYKLVCSAGIRSELLLSLLASHGDSPEESQALVLRSADDSAIVSTEKFLSSHLIFKRDEGGQDICLLRTETAEVGVMMGWETPISKYRSEYSTDPSEELEVRQTVEKLCSSHENLQKGLKILNIGFGLGIIDGFFRSLNPLPSEHFIIEAHPDVLRYMRDQGWYEKQGVRILEGKWQDFVQDAAILCAGGFDVVYSDTFSENYQELRSFFECLPGLLSGPSSRFSFFNGLGATNALFYDVYSQLAELHLSKVGVDVQWSDVDIRNTGGEDRWNSTRNYFSLPTYRLPLGKMNVV